MDEISDFSRPIRRVTGLTPVDSYLNGSWEALGAGAPVLVALAQLSSQAQIDPPVVDLEKLLPEAKAILFAAKDRGVVEVKAVNTAFEAASRMLAVYVELEDDRTIAFRDREKPEVTVRFLEGFRQLCEAGLMLHHIHRDFSLSSQGFDMARKVSREEVQPWLDKGTEFGIHD